MSTSLLTQRLAVPEGLRPLPGIAEALFVQADGSQLSLVADACAIHGLGVVYECPNPGVMGRNATDLIRAHREVAGGDATVLLDRGRYRGAGRAMVGEGINEEWVDAGLRWGASMAITDTGYVTQPHVESIRDVLRKAGKMRAARRGKLLVLLPLDATVLKLEADRVRDMVEAEGLPVVYMFGAYKDPLSSQIAMRGLRHLLASDVPSALARTDMSGIGALTLKASFTAIGVRPGQRHIFLPSNGGGGGGRDIDNFPIYFTEGKSYHKRDSLAIASAQLPDHGFWYCWCEDCQGRPLLLIDDPERSLRHALRAQARLAIHVLNGSTPDEAHKSWIAGCHDSQKVHLQIEAEHDPEWGVPDFLNAWVKTAP